MSAFLTRHGVAVKSQWQIGPVGETIANVADLEKHDLLIMGSVTTQVLAHRLPGHTAFLI